MILRLGLLAVVLLAATPGFKYERPVQLAAEPAPETCVALPPELMAHAAPRLQDLRLMAGDREVAYQLRVSGDADAEQAHAEQVLNLGERNGAVSFDVEMTEPRYSRVLLRMARSHFSVLMHVTGVEHTGEAGVGFPQIAWSSDEETDGLPQRILTLPESSFRYLHFELQTLALDPLTPQDIAGVDVLTEKTAPARYVQVAVANPPQQRPHQTVYEFAVPANLPVERLMFASDDVSAVFSRSATLERVRATSLQGDTESAPANDPLAEGITIEHAPAHCRPEFDACGEAAPSVAIAGMGAAPYPSTLRLTIENGDDAPLAIRGLTLQMRERQLCFLRRAGLAYMLRYGDPSLGTPQYDLSPIEAAAVSASVSTLGSERALVPEAAAGLRPFTERHPALLWVALVLVVGTLSFVAVRSAIRS